MVATRTKYPLCGPSYSSQSPNAECRRTVNWYPEVIGTDGNLVMYPTPGLADWPLNQLSSSPAVQSTAPTGFFEALIPFPYGTPVYGNLFAITRGQPVSGTFIGPNLFMLASDKRAWNLGNLVGASTPFPTWRYAVGTQDIVIASSAGAISLCSGIPAAPLISFPSSAPAGTSVAYLNGYFIALTASKTVYYTLDPANWNSADVFQVSTVADLPLFIMADHGELWIFSQLSTQVYSLTADPDNPFQPNPSGFIAQGIAAPDSAVALDNTIFWIGGDIRGQGVGWRANGYTPQRVTNHAVEYAWSQYSTIGDARAFAYQDQGHSFWHIYFPTAGKTWVYDVEMGPENGWHERSYLNPNTGVEEAALPQCHAFFFGKHLVALRNNPTISEMAIPRSDGSGGWNFVTDNGDSIKRTRRSMCISDQQKRVKYAAMQVYLETGLGPIPPLLGPLPGVGMDPNLFGWVNGSDPKFAAGTWTFLELDQTTGEWTNAQETVGSDFNAVIPATNYLTSTGWYVWATPDNWATIYSWTLTPAQLSGSTFTLEFNPDNNAPVLDSIYRAPQLMMRFSDDATHTWSNEQMFDCGKAGEYSTRVIARRLGQGRNRVFEISVTDPIPWRIIDGFVDAEECSS